MSMAKAPSRSGSVVSGCGGGIDGADSAADKCATSGPPSDKGDGYVPVLAVW